MTAISVRAGLHFHRQFFVNYQEANRMMKEFLEALGLFRYLWDEVE